MNTSDTTTERALIVALHDAHLSAEIAASALYHRLDHLDELDESVSIEQSRDNVRHTYTGEPVPWLQQRLGDAWRAVSAATDRLLWAAQELEFLARRSRGADRIEHIARGYLAFAAEAQRVVDSRRPCQDPVQVNWARVEAIESGIRRLEDIHDSELAEAIRHDLRGHDRRLADLRANGLDQIADHIAGDPELQRALGRLRDYVGEGRRLF